MGRLRQVSRESQDRCVARHQTEGDAATLENVAGFASGGRMREREGEGAPRINDDNDVLSG